MTEPSVKVIQAARDLKLLVVSGPLNERLRIADFEHKASTIAVELSRVERVTSFGVRQWLLGLQRIECKNLFFFKCRPSFVDQVNMVHGFTAHGWVASLFAPYECTECGASMEELIEVWRQPLGGNTPGPTKCVQCGGLTEFVDDPDSYLSYVRTQGHRRLPRTFQELLSLDGESVASATVVSPFEMQVRAVEGITLVELTGLVDARFQVARVLEALGTTGVIDLSGVVDVTDAGVRALRQLLAQSPVPVHFSGAPAALVIDLARRTPALLKGRLVTVQNKPNSRALDAVSLALERERARDGLSYCGMALPLIDGLLSIMEADPGDAVRRHITRGQKKNSASKQPADDERVIELTRLENHYDVLRRLGKGGMGEVLLAIRRGREGFRRPVVLKRVLQRHAGDDNYARLLLKEARVSAAIQHPNVINVIEFGQLGDDHCIVMEHLRGLDGRQLIDTQARLGGMLPIHVAARLVADVANGLHAAHQARDEDGELLHVVHRDISPENVILTEAGVGKITDFGVAHANIDGVETEPGMLRGKALYAAPEQIDPRVGAVSAQTDVFALGLLLFEVFTGASAFPQGNTVKTLLAASLGKVADVRERRIEVPAELAEVIRRATRLDPAERFPTALAMSEAIEDVLAEWPEPSASAFIGRWLEQHCARAREAGLLAADPDSFPSALNSALTSAYAQTVISKPKGPLGE